MLHLPPIPFSLYCLQLTILVEGYKLLRFSLYILRLLSPLFGLNIGVTLEQKHSGIVMIVPEAFNHIHGHMTASVDGHGVILGYFRDGCN
jgi:hypothetical protein